MDEDAAGPAPATVPTRPTRPAKRAFDVVAAALGLLASAPLWPLIAAAVRLEDGGPVFHAQHRVGRGGELFRSWKFRSMAEGEGTPDGPERQADPADARVTRVGRLVRATALDELPQLWSILVGDMSFVGPRPLLPEEKGRASGRVVRLDQVPGYAERHSVRPGLTGLAQVHAPRDLPPRDKFRYDRVYVRNRSARLDLELFLRSVWISLRGHWPRVGREEG